MVDGGGERPRQCVEHVEQRVHRGHVLLGQFRAALRLRLGHRFPEFLLQRAERLVLTVEFRDQRLLIGEFHGAERHQRIGHRGHFRVADVAQVFFDIRFHRRVGIEQPVGGGAVGAHVVHRLEQVRRGVGDHRNPARDLQAAPGLPGVEREAEHDAGRGDQDDGFQQRGYGQTVQHGAPNGFRAFGPKRVNT